MENILSKNEGQYISLTESFNNEVMITTYDNLTFEGTTVTLTKQQTKELINKLQEIIYND